MERRAIENYFTETAIQAVKGNGYKALGLFQNLKEADNPWAKSENWRIAQNMDFKDIGDTDLGKFLKDL